MTRNIITILLFAALLTQLRCIAGADTNNSTRQQVFGFESHGIDGLHEIWDVMPNGAAKLDLQHPFEGKVAARMERSLESDGDFSTIGFRVPIHNLEGQITVRAAVKADPISGMASLWARQDGAAGRVAYGNLREKSIRSDQNWTLHELIMEIDPAATSVSVGVFFAGTGRVFVDNFELLLNGEEVDVAAVSTLKASDSDSDSDYASGSNVTISTLSSAQTRNLSLFIKIWGFLKYHHPTITGGEIDWDAEFLNSLPTVLSFQSPQERNEWLSAWIDQIGEVNACDPCAAASTDVALHSETAWLSDETELGSTLTARLRHVHTNRPTGSAQHYVKPGPSGQAEFANEAAFSRLEHTDSGFRMLAVARYWIMIQYWFPYRDLIEADWDMVLTQALTDVVESQNEVDFQHAMFRMIASVEDSHAKLNSHLSVLPPIGTCDLPIHLRFVEHAPTVVELQDRMPSMSEFSVGDVIQKIDSKVVSELLDEMRPLYAASNTAAQNRDIAANLTRGPCGPAQITVERDGNTLTLSSQRIAGVAKNALSLPRDLPGDTVQILDGNIGYIKLSSVSREEIAEYATSIRSTDGLVLDLRNYPGDYTPYLIGQWFVETPTQFAMVTLPNFETPGEFVWQDVPPIPPVNSEDRIKVPIAILVDDVTQSSAEFTAMAFRALPNSIVVGSQTAGADGNISRITLPGNLSTTISGIGVFYPNRQPTQKIGIVPDLYVEPSRDGIIDGRDEVLEAALDALADFTGDD